MSNRRFAGDELKKLIADYEAGVPVYQLAQKYKAAHPTVAHALKREGVAVQRYGRKKGKSLSAKDEAQMVELYTTSLPSIAGIARQFEVSDQRVKRVLHQAGVWHVRRREKHQSWKGGRIVTVPHGYIMVRVDLSDPIAGKMANSSGYVMEHRLVMAQAMGRPLTPKESVHHLNGQVHDNRIENLQLRSRHHGHGQALRCRDCGSVNIEAYELGD